MPIIGMYVKNIGYIDKAFELYRNNQVKGKILLRCNKKTNLI